MAMFGKIFFYRMKVSSKRKIIVINKSQPFCNGYLRSIKNS